MKTKGKANKYQRTKPTLVRVLWVDDDKDLREIVKKIILDMGHHIDIAASGKEALNLLEENRYDLLITDVGMPGMTGWQLAETIKGKYKNMMVVVASGWSPDVTENEKEKYGVDFVLSKPFSLNILEQLVRQILGQKLNDCDY